MEEIKAKNKFEEIKTKKEREIKIIDEKNNQKINFLKKENEFFIKNEQLKCDKKLLEQKSNI